MIHVVTLTGKGRWAVKNDALPPPAEARRLSIDQTPVVTMIGKAFWDIGHAPKDGSNRRKRLPDYAVWEIHPAMKLTVQ
jgi:hypothetical protein